MSTYNLDMIQEMTDCDESFMKEMAMVFVEEMSEDIRAMNEAIDNENAALTYQIAHKMKPNLQMFGLELENEIKHLEAWSKSNLPKTEVLPSAKKTSSKVLKAIEELKIDFNL